MYVLSGHVVGHVASFARTIALSWLCGDTLHNSSCDASAYTWLKIAQCDHEASATIFASVEPKTTLKKKRAEYHIVNADVLILYYYGIGP